VVLYLSHGTECSDMTAVDMAVQRLRDHDLVLLAKILHGHDSENPPFALLRSLLRNKRCRGAAASLGSQQDHFVRGG
jgi:hypothetical protein